ncbi:MAG: monovalent cation/H(+) antiporter subunit G [Aaplasma endosymbiont of Hyalomma asiaticum]
MISTLGICLFCLGIAFKVISVIGVFRFSDFCSRVHAAGIVDSAGMTLTLVGIAMQYGFSMLVLKILVLICLLLVTNTTMCNILTSAACNAKGNNEELDN